MKKLIWGLGIILICLVSGCLKSNDNGTATCGYADSPAVAPNNEIDSVKKYLTLHALTATQHSTGFFYTITSPGTGQQIANLCSVLTVKYTGRLTNGVVFDSSGTGTATFQLGQVIAGWQKGLPLISKGGKITLYIPPKLGYGSTDQRNNAGVVIIPANSILIFDVELLEIS